MATAGTLDATVPGPQTVSLTGFRFSYRGAPIEWRLLHGIDPDAVVRAST